MPVISGASLLVHYDLLVERLARGELLYIAAAHRSVAHKAGDLSPLDRNVDLGLDVLLYASTTAWG